MNIFICTFDPFGKNLPVYHFENRTDTNPVVELKDGTHTYFFNCCYQGDEIRADPAAFYDFVQSEKASDPLTEELKKAVEDGRKNEIWRAEFMKERLIKDDYFREGKACGKKEGREEGIKEEQSRTEQERIRAEKAEREKREADKTIQELQEEVARLNKLLAK